MRVGIAVFDDVDYGLDLADALQRSGQSVVLYLSQKHTGIYLGNSDGAEERIHKLGLLPSECQVRLFRLPRVRNPRSALVIDQIARTMCRDDIDVAHLLVGPGDFWISALALRLRKIPVAATMIIPIPNVGDVLSPSIVVGIYRLLAKGTDIVIVNGKEQISLVQERYGLSPERVAYVPLGPRTTALRWAISPSSEERGAVLFFGAARPHKGLQYLVQAQPHISASIPHARFLIASRGEDLERCRELMRDREVFEVFQGFVPGGEAARFFQRASLVVLPYLSASTSGILTTAFVFGKPVVATRVGCLPEYVENGVTGLLVPPKDAELLAAAIIKLLSNDSLRQEMGRRALRWAEDMRQTIVDETVSVYQKAVALHDGH